MVTTKFGFAARVLKVNENLVQSLLDPELTEIVGKELMLETPVDTHKYVVQGLNKNVTMVTQGPSVYLPCRASIRRTD